MRLNRDNMSFIIQVTNIVQNDEDFGMIYTLECEGKHNTFYFSRGEDSNLWLDYIYQNHNALFDQSTIIVTNDAINFNKWIKKVTPVKFGEESVEFSLVAESGDRYFFYFSDKQKMDEYTQKHMTFYYEKDSFNV